MVFQPQDAEEVTQEVLIKAVTGLSTFRADSKFRTWLYRITANHVLNMRRRGGETPPISFTRYAAALDGTPDLDLPDPKSVPVDVPLLVEEAKIACTTGDAPLSGPQAAAGLHARRNPRRQRYGGGARFWK